MSSKARRQAKMGFVFHFILLAQIKCMTFATACKFLQCSALVKNLKHLKKCFNSLREVEEIPSR